MTIRYSTPEARAAAVVSGMIAGVEEVYAKLDSLLPRLIPDLGAAISRSSAPATARSPSLAALPP